MTCKYCNGTGQPGGVIGCPERGVCGHCLGTGDASSEITNEGPQRGTRDVIQVSLPYLRRVVEIANRNEWSPEGDALAEALRKIALTVG